METRMVMEVGMAVQTGPGMETEMGTETMGKHRHLRPAGHRIPIPPEADQVVLDRRRNDHLGDLRISRLRLPELLQQLCKLLKVRM
jgi:hypothetical protein